MNDPPKRSAEAVFSPCEGEGPPSGGSAPPAGSAPQTAYLPRWRHDGVAAVVEDCDVGLVDHPVAPKDHPGDRWVSFDQQREEIVVEVEGHPSRMANVAVRLATALTSNELMYHAVDLPARMDDGGPFQGFDLPPLDDPRETRVLLRKGHCLGYLLDEYEHGSQYVDRLRREREDLLSEAANLVGSDGDYRGDIAGEVLPDAVGLASTMIRIYELLGVDVVTHLTFPDWTRNVGQSKPQRRDSVCELLSYLTTINATYGVYPMFRTLYEDREEKRDDALQGPGVDPEDPTGELLGSWVLSGPGIDDFADDLEHLTAGWEVHDDALDRQQEFRVDVDVRQGWRREVAVRAANRVLDRKRLALSSETTSALVGLLGSPFSVPRALNRLGAEPFDSRHLELDEVRWALSSLPEWELLPSTAPAVQSIVAVLLEADDPLSTSELATAADVDAQTVRAHRDRLEALGLLVVDEQGPGRATLHRLALPTRDERGDPDAPRPALLDVDGPLAHAVEEALNRLGDSIAVHRPRLWKRIWPADGDDVDEVWKSDRWKWLRSWGDVLAGFAGEEVGGRLDWGEGPYRRDVQIGERLDRPTSRQMSLDEALGLVPAD